MTTVQQTFLRGAERTPPCSLQRRFLSHQTAASKPANAQQQLAVRGSRLQVKAESSTQQTNNAEDLEAQMEEFLKRQQEAESGQALAQSELDEDQGPVGTSEISEEDAKRMCREIVRVARLLASKRDMGLNELKLIVAVEDPRVKERRSMGIEEGDYGCSRDEMAAALVDVSEGRIPKDRIALRALYSDLKNWPFLGSEAELDDEGTSADYSGITNTGVQGGGARPPQQRKQLGRDPSEKPKSLTDMLPDWVGYGALYGISIVPIIIGGAVVTVLFLNSLK
ncbi:hypothetical protein WJX84_008403 [Apatococcus fuscideae]|uniref:Ycf3-interacting protein 1, chloroplastic n=1 Tax=Apatococcus fuscideae TaxID=2026836 RepID=A0AAW1T7J5_9CHLO